MITIICFVELEFTGSKVSRSVVYLRSAFLGIQHFSLAATVHILQNQIGSLVGIHSWFFLLIVSWVKAGRAKTLGQFFNMELVSEFSKLLEQVVEFKCTKQFSASSLSHFQHFHCRILTKLLSLEQAKNEKEKGKNPSGHLREQRCQCCCTQTQGARGKGFCVSVCTCANQSKQ